MCESNKQVQNEKKKKAREWGKVNSLGTVQETEIHQY